MKMILVLFLSFFVTLSSFATTPRVLDGATITNQGAVLTLPTTTDTIMGAATTNTVTNKSYSGASNTFTNIPTSAIAGSALSGTNTGDVTIGTANGLSVAGQALSLQAATASLPGALLAADFTTFAAKLTSALTNGHIFVGNGSGVATDVAVSGDATISNSGVVTIGAKKVQASKLDSGAAASGTVATADGSGGVSYSAIPSSATNVVGTEASPTAVTAAGGVVFSGSQPANLYFINGSGGAVTLTATPQITAGAVAGTYLDLVGGANTVTIADGNGMSLNGSWVGGSNSGLSLFWTGTVWRELSRR